MQTTTDPKTGDRLSVLGFGCMRFPMDAGKTERLILKAIESGVNYFDTAYIYPGSEATLGRILEKHNLRDKVHIATKLPFQKCKTADDFDRIFNEQRERLKTAYIDYYLIHNISDLKAWRHLQEMGIEAWIQRRKAEGTIRRFGFSFHGSQRGFLDLIEAADWDFCQIQYNYMDENYQAGRAGLYRATELGIPVVIMEPLLGGKLATGLPPKALKLFKEAAPGRSAASWAFRWLWNQPGITVVLSGMNGEDQLEDNLAAAADAKPGMLTEAESAVFPPVVAALREAYKISCTGCNYCMPCPQGVNIPGCFAAYNTSFVMGYVSGMTQYLTGTGVNHPEKKHGARNCTQCGACVKKCPQQINIPTELKAVTKRLEPLWFKPILWAIRKFMG
ncbi:MAG: aldo/keto reductase [Oscillospiraceae bacterium]|jgi:predicted aldo/keto reductase-like oxidoreductase|nr:aldo/keto reductase [Oscillospiraceae bacterium]